MTDATQAVQLTPSQDRLAAVHPVLRQRVQGLISLMDEQGLEILVMQGLRTYAEQQAIYDQGRKTPGPIVSDAQPGYSWHQFALAVDVAPEYIVNGKPAVDWNPQHPDWQKLLSAGAAFKLSEGAKWRTFKDWPHFYPEELPATPPQVVRAIYSARVAQDAARSPQAGIDAVSEWFEKLLG